MRSSGTTLSLTGGGTPFAKLDNIIIVRGAASGQRVLSFRYGQVAEGKHLEQNVILESGDVVIVPSERMPTSTGAAAIYRF